MATQIIAWCLATTSIAEPGQGAESKSASALAGDSATEYLVDVWGTDEGLPNNTVTDITQTPDGYLWCSTYDGVVRYDGVRFIRIGPDDPVNQQANRVLCLHVDRRGQLWLGTDGAGLFLYEGGTFTAYAEPARSDGNIIRAIAEDTAGDLWLGTRGGLARWSNGKLTWSHGAAASSSPASSIWNLAFDHEGRLWMTDWGSLKAYRDGRFETTVLHPPPKLPLRALYADAGGNMWAGMLGQAFRRGPDGQWVSVDAVAEFANTEVVAFCRTRSGDFWVGTRRGLCRERDGRWMAFARDELVRSEVRVLFEDREENLWVGTGTRGLARLKRRMLTTYTARHGLSDKNVWALREKPTGGLWVGLEDGRLVHGTPGAFHPYEEAAGLPKDAPVKSVLHTRDGALWVGTFGSGLTRFHEDASMQFKPSVGSPARIDKVTAFLEDRAGSVWIGTFYALYKATPTNVLVPVPVGGREVRSHVTALLEDKAGGIWVAYHGLGVAQILDDKATWITRREGLPTGLIRTLHQDSAGTLWIGTAAGLCASRQGKISTFTRAHGLADDTISQILEDDADNLWLGSNRGIMRVAKRELHAVAEGRKASLEVFACGRGEGMLSVECSGGFHPAGLRTTDGKLWFPTTRGLVMVDPSQLLRESSSLPPPVHIEEVWVDGKLVARPHESPGGKAAKSPTDPALLLPHSMRRLEFIYTALSFTAPERVRFKHRLEGFDPDWTEPDPARSTAYAKLPPGRYRFQVIACDNDGVWNEAGRALSFRIAAPFWQTWWFMTLTGIASAGVLGGFVRMVSVRQWRLKLRRLEEAHAVEKERMRIAQDMHDEIGGKLSRISFLSDMARRGVPGESEASQQIDEVSEAAREVIRTVDEIVWAVSPRNDTLESLTHYICRHAEEFFELTPVDLELGLPSEFPAHRLSAEVRHNLFCAVKEALNNVLKHAEATRVRIAFVVTRSAFQVTVTDNGRGFHPEAVLATAGTGGNGSISARRGNGLLNMRERLESIRGQCLLESQPAQGTQAVFTVPLRQGS